MSYGWPAPSFGMNPYGYSAYPSNAFAPYFGENPYGSAPPMPSGQGYPQSPGTIQNAMQSGSPTGHRPLTRKKKVAIIIGSIAGGLTLIAALALIVKRYRKPAQAIQNPPVTFRPEGGIYPMQSAPQVAHPARPPEGRRRLSKAGGERRGEAAPPTREEILRQRYADRLRNRVDEMEDAEDQDTLSTDIVFRKILECYAENPEYDDLLSSASAALNRKKTVKYFVNEFERENRARKLENMKPLELRALFQEQGYHEKVAAEIKRGRLLLALGLIPGPNFVAIPLLARHAYKYRKMK